MLVLSVFLVLSGLLLAVPVAVFCGEVCAGLLSRRGSALLPAPHLTPRQSFERPTVPAARPRVAVIVPAHDEELNLAATLRTIRPQLRAGDRLVVVADNCTDATARVAAEEAAEVVVRTDPAARGKGYALDAGIRFVAADAPDVVVFVDADCRLGPGALDALAETAQTTRRPAQGCYLILAPPGARQSLLVAEFAQIVKNRIRPAGLLALGLPCQLAGSGMAFPWPIIAAADLASGETVEDLALGIACAMDGHPPIYCPQAVILSEFPTSPRGAATQSQRWKHGHLRLIARAVRPLAVGLRRLDGQLVAQVLDLMVPPLTLLLLSTLVLAGIDAAAALAGASVLPLAIGAASLAALVGAILAAWWADSGALTPARLTGLLPYLAASLALYPRLLSRRPRSWIRTERGGPP